MRFWYFPAPALDGFISRLQVWFPGPFVFFVASNLRLRLCPYFPSRPCSQGVISLPLSRSRSIAEKKMRKCAQGRGFFAALQSTLNNRKRKEGVRAFALSIIHCLSLVSLSLHPLDSPRSLDTPFTCLIHRSASLPSLTFPRTLAPRGNHVLHTVM